jgi:hypothetical protein
VNNLATLPVAAPALWEAIFLSSGEQSHISSRARRRLQGATRFDLAACLLRTITSEPEADFSVGCAPRVVAHAFSETHPYANGEDRSPAEGTPVR